MLSFKYKNEHEEQNSREIRKSHIYIFISPPTNFKNIKHLWRSFTPSSRNKVKPASWKKVIGDQPKHYYAKES